MLWKKNSWILHYFKADGKASHWGKFIWFMAAYSGCRMSWLGNRPTLWSDTLWTPNNMKFKHCSWSIKTHSRRLCLIKAELKSPYTNIPSFALDLQEHGGSHSIKIRKQGVGGLTQCSKNYIWVALQKNRLDTVKPAIPERQLQVCFVIISLSLTAII